MISKEQIDNWFTYHPPKDGAQVAAYARIREAGKAFAEAVVRETPASADQTAAIRLIREAVMTANAALACEGR